ncbi:unnamed protein product [Spirodela intermedia]|uniref:G domain-containing protein n=1 Tax=Spirodela intermedia TaxID=51605 RepID=A0A7I8IVX1_SPIIN|nr:unnamed protein product [Spirodela intermedia]CAA6662136.1 unnamed protein product [Spirodela intermedia]
MDDMKMFMYETLAMFSNPQALDISIQDESRNSHNYEEATSIEGKPLVAGFTKLDDKEIELVEAERVLLLEAIEVIRKAAPLMDEVSLLEDAVSRLDEPFMMVIVGEFNSGKSTIINALLGRRYLKEGVVPTTNEITLLCYSEIEKSEKCEMHPDGQFICYLPAPILKEMNLVDTPGTNVILQRQQRLTEEFVPRADLVIFALSSDRPLTESEVNFLRYMQQWKKKVLFVLNKSDLYQNNSELEEGLAFVKENARRFLNQESVTIYPVSARSALEAKLSASSSDLGNYSEQVLLDDARWVTSGFRELEDFLYSFLDGSTDTGMERMKLKLNTPIGIADRLLSACEAQVKHEYECATNDLSSINDLIGSVKSYAMKMENESISWTKRTVSLVEKAKARAVKLVESTLQLSNIDLISTYAFKRERSSSISSTSVIQNEIISPALAETKGSDPPHDNNRVLLETLDLMKRGDELSIKVTGDFSSSAAAKLLEQEIREVVSPIQRFLSFCNLLPTSYYLSFGCPISSIYPFMADDCLHLRKGSWSHAMEVEIIRDSYYHLESGCTPFSFLSS